MQRSEKMLWPHQKPSNSPEPVQDDIPPFGYWLFRNCCAGAVGSDHLFQDRSSADDDRAAGLGQLCCNEALVRANVDPHGRQIVPLGNSCQYERKRAFLNKRRTHMRSSASSRGFVCVTNIGLPSLSIASACTLMSSMAERLLMRWPNTLTMMLRRR